MVPWRWFSWYSEQSILETSHALLPYPTPVQPVYESRDETLAPNYVAPNWNQSRPFKRLQSLKVLLSHKNEHLHKLNAAEGPSGFEFRCRDGREKLAGPGLLVEVEKSTRRLGGALGQAVVGVYGRSRHGRECGIHDNGRHKLERQDPLTAARWRSRRWSETRPSPCCRHPACRSPSPSPDRRLSREKKARRDQIKVPSTSRATGGSHLQDCLESLSQHTVPLRVKSWLSHLSTVRRSGLARMSSLIDTPQSSPTFLHPSWTTSTLQRKRGKAKRAWEI